MLKKTPWIHHHLKHQKGNEVPQHVRGPLLTNITSEQFYTKGPINKENQKILAYFTQQIQRFENHLMRANKNNTENINELISCRIGNLKKTLWVLIIMDSVFFFFYKWT